MLFRKEKFIKGEKYPPLTRVLKNAIENIDEQYWDEVVVISLLNVVVYTHANCSSRLGVYNLN